jgi:hypothetical protein
MPFTSPTARLAAVQRDLRSLGDPNGSGQRFVLSGIRRAILRGPLREEFQTGIGPKGPWQPTARGKQALQSKKLAGAFTAELLAGAVQFEGVVRRNWLEAHQFGHSFPARKTSAQQQFLTFNRKGRLIKNGKALNKKGEIKRGVHQTFAKPHIVKAHVLPARPMVPTGTTLPAAWEAAASAGASEGLERWAKRVTR